jgi:membrane fusion protein, multidrug efflux system
MTSATSWRLPARHLLLTLLAASGLLACAPKESAPEPVRAVRTQVVGADSALLNREFAAEVRARTEQRLGFRVGGKLLSREVDLGQRVRAGQVLARLDPVDLRLGEQAAQSAVAAARANQELAAADLKRYQSLHAQGFISGIELDRRNTTLQATQAQLDQALAQARVQGNQSGYSTLTATSAGVVTAVEAEPGAVLSSGTPVLRLALDGPRDAVFSVPEDFLTEVRAVQGKAGALRVKPWGSSDMLPATLRELSAAADPVTRTFLAKADLGTTTLALGRTATVVLAAPPLNGVNKLPLSAVMQHEGRTAVWLLDPAAMTVRVQPIEVAGAEGNTVLVAAGLSPGQVVVTAGVHTLNPGQKVRRYVEPTASPAAAASVPAR